jgi:hypothetical protein
MTNTQKTTIALWAYAIAAIICFGPAQVESDRDEDARYERCKADRGAEKCQHWGGGGEKGVFKAMFWPAWLSYTVARKVS